MAQEYFCAYHSLLKSLEPLNDAERGRLFTSCLQYSATGEVPDLRGNERFLFPMMKEQIDRDKEKYRAKCEKQAQNASMRWHATACDGMPMDAKDAKTKEKTHKKKPTVSNTPLTPLEGAIEEFKAHRKKLGKPMTDRAVQLFRGELEKLAPSDDRKKIALINHAIMKGWQSVYPIDERRAKRGTGSRANYAQRPFDPQDLEDVFLKFEEE